MAANLEASPVGTFKIFVARLEVGLDGCNEESISHNYRASFADRPPLPYVLYPVAYGAQVSYDVVIGPSVANR